MADLAELRKRREMLQLRLRRQAEARQFRELAPRLHARGVRRFSRLPSLRAQALVAPFAHLPGRDERFYWPEIPGHACARWESAADRSAAFREGLRACFPASARLALVFHPAESGLLLRGEDALAHADTLLANLYDTLWVLAARGSDALVELSFADREACWLARA